MTLHLLDFAQAHPVQTWHFKDRARVAIGRAPESDIRLASGQISRLHAELVYGGGDWRLHSHGRNGTHIDGVPISEALLRDRTIFQLGSSGPSFQFMTVNHSSSSQATIDDIDPHALDFLTIDEQRKSEEVDRIAESEAFRQLQQQAYRLKHGEQHRAEDSDH